MTSAVAAGLILIIGIVVLIAIGAPIAVAIGLPSMLAAVSLLGVHNGTYVASQQMVSGMNSFALLAIPLFVLAGVLMNNGGIAARLIDAAKVVTGRMPGSLAQTNVVANAMFGSVSGAAVASAAAVGSVMTPRQRQEGYRRDFSAAVNVASAPAGMLIPPSNTFIVYSLVSGSSIAALFLSGYGPGLLWTIACLIVVYLYARRHPEVRTTQQRVSFRTAALVIWRAVPALLMIVVVIGGILLGFFTPTESAGIAVVYSLLLGFIYRNLRIRDLFAILVEATRTTSIVMLLVGVSGSLSWVMTFTRIPEAIADTLLSVTHDPAVILIIILVILLAVGTFMDPTPAILIFTPIFLPIVEDFGMDPIQFGAVSVMALSVGTITPPVGNVLFIGARVAGIGVEPVIRRLVPFFIAITAMLLVVTFVSQLSMWLPTVFGLTGG